MLTRFSLLIAVALLVIPDMVKAQAPKATGDLLASLLDNDRVRVLTLDLAPGAKLPPRNFPNHLLVMVTDGTLVFSDAGRTPYEITFKAGEAFWFAALTRGLQNDTDKAIRVLVVELKDGAGRTAAKTKTKAKPKTKPKSKK